MVRIILGAIVGYVAYSILLFVLFSGLYLLLGAGGSFQAGNYDLTMSWVLPGIVVFFVGGAVASLVCGLIAKNAKSGLYMGGVILALGLLVAFMQIAQDPGITARGTEEIGLIDAMNKAHGPIWTHFANAVAGFVGAVTGGNLFSKSE
jgi:hypothetical protein